MTAPEPMSRKELLELAALDVYGLLDEYESALYTRSFHHAPASVQTEILELQATLAADASLLPEMEPSTELRAKVISAVTRAVEQDTPAPLASIGRSKSVPAPRLRERHEPASERIERTRYASTAHFWRASTFVLSGIVLVMVFFLMDAVRQGNNIAELALNQNTRQSIDALEKEIGPVARDYLSHPDARRIVLTGSDSDAWANLLVLEDRSEALLITENLPRLESGQMFRLIVRHEDGTTEELHRFEGHEHLAGRRVQVSFASLSAANTWEIHGPDDFVISSARA